MRSFFVVGLCFIVRLCFVVGLRFVVELCFVKAAAVSFCSSLLFFLSVGLFVFAVLMGLYRPASWGFTARPFWSLPLGLFGLYRSAHWALPPGLIGLYRPAHGSLLLGPLGFAARPHGALLPGLFVWIVWSVLSLPPGHLLIEFVVPQGVVHRRVGRDVIPHRHKESGAAHPFAFCRRDSSQSRRGCVFAASSPSTPILPFAV